MALPGGPYPWPDASQHPWAGQNPHFGAPPMGWNEPLCQAGEPVLYLSRQTGQWIPAVVLGYNNVPGPYGQETMGSYRLDVKADAHPNRVKRYFPTGTSGSIRHHQGSQSGRAGSAAIDNGTSNAGTFAARGGGHAEIWSSDSSPLYDGGFAGNITAQRPVTRLSSFVPNTAKPGHSSHTGGSSFPGDGFAGNRGWGGIDGLAAGGGSFGAYSAQVTPLPVGEPVFYLSRSSGQWVPATVQGHSTTPSSGEMRYHLDVQSEAEPLRVIRRADFDVKFSGNPPGLEPALDAAYLSQGSRRASAPAVVMHGSGNSSSHATHPDPLMAGFGPLQMEEQSMGVPGVFGQPQPQQADLAFDGELQEGLGPEMWGIYLEQLEDLLHDPRCSGEGMQSLWGPAKWTTREIVDRLIKPDTDGTGVGYAVTKNIKMPLKARIMVSHSWDAEFKDLVAALRDTRENGPYWVCAMAMYQGEDAMPNGGIKAGRDPGLGPFAHVLRKVEHVLCVLTSACNIFTRLWCLFEISTAAQLGVPVKFTQKHRGQSWGIVHDPLLDLCKEPVSSESARCGPPAGRLSSVRGGGRIGMDEKALRDSIEFYPGGYSMVDHRVEQVRLDILIRRRDRLDCAGFRETEISRDYQEVIEMVSGRLGISAPPRPSDSSEMKSAPGTPATLLRSVSQRTPMASPRNTSFGPVAVRQPTPQRGTPVGTPRGTSFGAPAMLPAPFSMRSRSQTPSRSTSFQRSQTPSRSASFRSQTPPPQPRSASFQAPGWMPGQIRHDGQCMPSITAFAPNAVALVPPVMPPTTVWPS